MLYCEKCKRLVTDEASYACECGNKSLRNPLVNDAVYYTTASGFDGSIIEQYLTEYEIPFLKKGVGYAVTYQTVVSGFGTNDYFIPYGAWEKAVELFDEYFTNEED